MGSIVDVAGQMMVDANIDMGTDAGSHGPTNLDSDVDIEYNFKRK